MPADPATAPASVGTLNEGHLHASIRSLYVQPGDLVEAPVDGYIADVLRTDGQIIEIQTGSFAKIARKMRDLVTRHRVRLVYPLPRDLWIVKLPRGVADVQTRRKSPKRRTTLDVFAELVSFPGLIAHENFSLDVVVTAEEAVWRYDSPKRWRRRGWVTVERRLLSVHDTLTLEQPDDFAAFLPPGLAAEFTTAELADASKCQRRLAQQMAYCLSRCGCIERVGSRGNAIVYGRVSASA